jgi:gamma-glutamyltranspeptidase/glutathione hydrolase
MRSLLLALIVFLSACATAPRGARSEAVIAAANPHASEAGAEMLRRGGSATDAAIAAMLVLGLVEPQSAGLGGGGFLMHYDPDTRAIDAYDGREIAPAGARPDMFLDAQGEPLPFLEARKSGAAVGAPSLVPMLKLVHDAHGRLPWPVLFEPAIRLAENGFAVSPRMHRIIAGSAARNRLRESPSARAYLFTPAGEPLPVGHVLRNPAYAETLRAIAREGPHALTHGRIAGEIVAAAQAQPRPGTLTLADLQRVTPRRLDAVCGSFRVYRVCSMPPPSSGGIAVIEILGLFERARPDPEGVQDTDDWAAFLWASRLAYSDRDHYVADDQFVPVPTRGLVDPRYVDERARLIALANAPRGVSPGDPSRVAGGPSLLDHWGRDLTREAAGTTHLSVIDNEGNVVALTATIESEFGAHRMAGGFFLNNQLTDFSLRPTLNGRPLANAVAPGKRPRSSMAPVLMFERDGDFHAAIGSPGGSAIIAYVARTIVGFTDWDLSMQQAIDVPHLIAAGPIVRQEPSVSRELVAALGARGWRLNQSAAEDSGLHGFVVTPNGIDAGADPRREGVVVRVPATNPR